MGDKEFIKGLKLFFKGMFDVQNSSTSIIKKEAADEMDKFFLLCFGDYMGLLNPCEYDSMVFLPYINDKLEPFTRRMHRRKSVTDRFGDVM